MLSGRGTNQRNVSLCGRSQRQVGANPPITNRQHESENRPFLSKPLVAPSRLRTVLQYLQPTPQPPTSIFTLYFFHAAPLWRHRPSQALRALPLLPFPLFSSRSPAAVGARRLALLCVVPGICLRRRRQWPETMGRGRVQLKRIENKINRQVTFSKRRSGLLKKAHEISVLCEAEVALIVFSTKGKLYEYSTDSRMERILERYERYSYAERALVATDAESQESWCLEYSKLKAKVDSLLKSQRNFLGEDLENLNLKDLQHLETQLEGGLKQIRTRKNHLLFDSIAELQRKGKILQEQNNMLEKMVTEKERLVTSFTQQASWDQQQQQQENPSATSGSSSPPPLALIDGPATTLNIGTYQPREEEEANQSPPRISNKLPPWMLRHVNAN